MQLKLKHIWLGLLMLAAMEGARAQRINATQQLAAMDSIRVLLEQYADWHRFTADGVTLSDSIIEKFNGLFDTRPGLEVLNDLEPGREQAGATPSSDAGSITLSEYIAQAEQNYPRGLFIEMDHELDHQSDVLYDAKAQRYYLYVPVSKSLTGFYQASRVHRYEGEQVLGIGFKGTDMTVEGFRILEIITPRELSRREIRQRWKGFYAGLSFAAAQNHLLNHPPFGDDPYPDLMNTPEISFSAGAVIQYNFGAGAGIETGVLYRNYRATQSIISLNKEGSSALTDQDQDRYFPIAEVDSFRSELSLTMIDIPLLLHLRPVTGRNAAWNIHLGVRNLLLLNGRSRTSGRVEYKGYYPEYPVILYDIPDYGFLEERFPGQSLSYRTDQYTLTGSFGTGLDLRIGKRMFASLGIRADYTLLTFSGIHTALSEDYHDLILSRETRLMIFNAYAKVLYKIR